MCRRYLWMIAVGAGIAAAQSSVTLEQLMSAPFPSELTPAPRGDALAWVVRSAGVRNIWAAEGPNYRARRVTSYSADDGQELSDLRYTPDEGSIIYVRGGEAGRDGDYPNPLSSPGGAEQAVWMVSARGGEPKRIDEGHAPAVSPKGDGVAYVKKKQIWWSALEGKQEPVQLVKTRGECGTLTWSPGGSALAFVVTRDGHSLIGVYEVATNQVRYLDPGLDRDGSPAWSPDGRHVAFLRIPASRTLDVFGPKRSAEPWSIRVADVATGQGRQVWRARPGTGSVFHGVTGEAQLLWADQDRLVFPWEGDGWTHLYEVPASGGRERLLTPGAFEVEDAVLSRDGKLVVFSSNQDDIDRRHIWRVSAGAEKPAPVTGGSGLEWSPVVTAGSKTIAFLRSGAKRPARAAVEVAGSVRDLAPETIPAGFPENSLVEPQPVVISARDGLALHGQLFLPGGEKHGGRSPAVIFLHGGSRRQMLLGWHMMFYYYNAYAMNQYLASRGYVVLTLNYRSGIGYGMEFREALNYGATGGSEFNDILGAASWLRSRPDVDPGRIGLWGGSYGGYLAALGLARASDLFAAGVDLHGVHDWRSETQLYVSSDDLETQQAALRLAFQSSPVASVSTWRSPVLLIHGDDDRNVDFRQTIQLAEALRRQGVEFEQLVFPDEVHDFLTHAHWLAAYRAAADFLDRRLR